MSESGSGSEDEYVDAESELYDIEDWVEEYDPFKDYEDTSFYNLLSEFNAKVKEDGDFKYVIVEKIREILEEIKFTKTRLGGVEKILHNAFKPLPESGNFEDRIIEKIQALLSDVSEDRESLKEFTAKLKKLLEGVALVDFDGGYDEGRARADYTHKVKDLTKVPFKEALNAWHVQ